MDVEHLAEDKQKRVDHRCWKSLLSNCDLLASAFGWDRKETRLLHAGCPQRLKGLYLLLQVDEM